MHSVLEDYRTSCYDSGVEISKFFKMGEYTYDEDGLPVLRDELICNKYENEADITNIFDINGDGYDVTLSLASGTISWTSVNPGRGKGGKGLANLFKSKKSKTGLNGGSLDLRKIFGVKIKRHKPAKNKEGIGKEGEGLCLGFYVYTYETFGPNCLKEKVIAFDHPSETMCKQYCKQIACFIEDLPGRPKSIKLFLQPWAGGNHVCKDIYKSKILPLFQAAEVNIDCVEVQHNEHIKQEMTHINLSDYDCIACMGGDGTVNKVAGGLLNRTQSDHDIDMKPGFTPARAPIPLGIIPLGMINQIGRSVLGISDPVTAVIHIILGNHVQIDVSSVFHEDRLIKWSFISQYGFGGNVLALSRRYLAGIGTKGLDAAFVKALTKSKLRPYDCDVEFIPADVDPVTTKNKFQTCRTGCDVCWKEETDDTDSVTNDLVEDFNPLNNSNSSSGIVDLSKEETPWRTCKGSYLHVSLCCIPGNSEIAPEGLSKFSHLSDGVMDLILVKNVPKRDFVRFIKRHGNNKNQLNFDFVERRRVKEVKFKPRLPTGWNYKDHTFNEIQYEMRKLKNKRASESMDIIEMDDETGGHDILSDRKKRSHSLQMLGERSDDECEDLEYDDEDDDLDNDDDLDDGVESIEDLSQGSKGSATNSSTKSSKKQAKNTNDVIINKAHQDHRLIGPQYRPTFSDMERQKRKNKQIKKEEKKKAKEQTKLFSVWNIDNEILDEKDQLHFRIHHGLLSICGVGVSPDTMFTESSIMCLPLMK